MNTKTVEEVVEPKISGGAVKATDSNTAAPSEQPSIRYATDAEVDEAMKKIFEWHGPLLAKLAE